jgi:hypothetical protein
MANVNFGLRTIGSNAQLFQYVDVAGVPAKRSLSYAVKPTGATIDPGITLGDLKTTDCYGATTTALTYIQETQPTIQLTFPAPSADVLGLIFGNSFATANNTPIPVPFELTATQTTFPARPSTEIGFSVAPGAIARAWTISPTGITTELVIGSDVTIGAQMQITLSQALVDAGAEVRGWVMATASTAAVMSSTAIGLVGIYLTGVDFGGRVATFSAEYCSLAFGASLAAGSDPQVTFRILPNPNSISKKGYDWVFPGKLVSC